MNMNRQGRPSDAGEVATGEAHATFTGNRGLMIEEPLIFETGRLDVTGVDLDEPGDVRLAGWEVSQGASRIGLPGLTEPEAMRHYVRLSQKNYAIDSGLYPLGSCTMKHNPRLNEKMARLPGFGDIHPLQPVSTVQGALELIDMLRGLAEDADRHAGGRLSPKAGAHGELCGMMAIKAALDARGEASARPSLVPDSAHGTNPATAALLGYKVVSVAARDDGTVDPKAVREAMSGPRSPRSC